MTVEQLNIAFRHRLPVMMCKPNLERIRYKEIFYIEYARTRYGNIRVNACLVDAVSPRSLTTVELKYIEPCLSDTPDDDDGETYHYNTDEPDYQSTAPLEIDEDIKRIFKQRRPVEVIVNAKLLPTETQQNLLGCVINADKDLTLKFAEVKRLKIYLDHNREPVVMCDFDLGVDIAVNQVKERTIIYEQ